MAILLLSTKANLIGIFGNGDPWFTIYIAMFADS